MSGPPNDPGPPSLAVAPRLDWRHGWGAGCVGPSQRPLHAAARPWQPPAYHQPQPQQTFDHQFARTAPPAPGTPGGTYPCAVGKSLLCQVLAPLSEFRFLGCPVARRWFSGVGATNGYAASWAPAPAGPHMKTILKHQSSGGAPSSWRQGDRFGDTNKKGNKRADSGAPAVAFKTRNGSVRRRAGVGRPGPGQDVPRREPAPRNHRPRAPPETLSPLHPTHMAPPHGPVPWGGGDIANFDHHPTPTPTPKPNSVDLIGLSIPVFHIRRVIPDRPTANLTPPPLRMH